MMAPAMATFSDRSPGRIGTRLRWVLAFLLLHFVAVAHPGGGVQHEDLIAVEGVVDAITGGASSRRSRRRSVASGDLSATFGVELEEPAVPVHFEPSAASIAALRTRLQLDPAAFAQAAGVSLATVKKWETSEGPLRLQARSLDRLREIDRQARESG